MSANGEAPTDAAPELIATQLERRRREVAALWSLSDEVVVIGAGEPIAVPGRGDRAYPFRAHSEYLYLTDRERPSGVLAYDPETGWDDFVNPISRTERLWEGAMSASDEGQPLAELDDWLARRSGRPIARLGAACAKLADVAGDAQLEERTRRQLNEVRRRKDEVELHRMRLAEAATRAAFVAIAAQLRAGVSERTVQIALEAEFFRHGADFLAFETIVAAGSNAAVLHYAPSARLLADGDLVLIDAGGEFRGYASDVTRTYAASGRFSTEQAELHALVRAAAIAAIEACRPGAEFYDVDRIAALTIADGLVEFGLLRGSPADLVERGSVSLFFPHGVGHMLGLGVRDAGAALEGRAPRARGFVKLRVDLPLLTGYTMTIEPGVYFVPALLGDAELREQHRDVVDWDRAEAMLDFGGIRVEDNVLITDAGCDVLTDDVPLL
jgi:Xaa-Pro aminopeptidase